jgi:hypothetical protein
MATGRDMQAFVVAYQRAWASSEPGARRLLDETDLPIAQIAFAAGFASVRTMNATMRRIFRSPPSVLRARRSHRGREVADGGLRLTVALPGPLGPGFYRRMPGACIDGVDAVAAWARPADPAARASNWS